ncbi:MAG TPA: sodium/glutamate symporter [Gemmatimonadales bacterium]|nr:sodium/glutamate symporter [Gemmatimonadales bacterium]
MTELKLDLLQTLSLAGLVYFGGIQLRKRIAWLDRLNIPAAVVGGLLFTTLVLLLRQRSITIVLDTAMQATLSVAFFTSIGMGASLALLRRGGLQVLIFLILATLFCLVQNFLGIAIALGFDENPLLGVMAGSVTLVGGPATGLAFAPVFEQAGLRGAGPLALTAATAGIVCGGLVGGPVGTYLIRRFGLASTTKSAEEAKAELEGAPETLIVEVDREDSGFIRNLVVLGLAMGIGSIVSAYIQSLGITLPAYIGAMLVASALRNLDDATGWLRIDVRAMEFAGNLALNIFLVVALMNLKLWELAGLALPLFVILVAQVIVVVLFALTVSFRVMGKDYESAVMASGFIGFVLGTTANAVANMRALVARFGAAPRAFLVVPLVGAFFIDFANAIIITFFVNWFK